MMKKLLVLGLAIFLSSVCVSQPAPWTPDARGGDGKSDSGRQRADGTGDVRVGDLARVPVASGRLTEVPVAKVRNAMVIVGAESWGL